MKQHLPRYAFDLLLPLLPPGHSAPIVNHPDSIIYGVKVRLTMPRYLYELYVGRIRHLCKEPPRLDWDVTWTFDIR